MTRYRSELVVRRRLVAGGAAQKDARQGRRPDPNGRLSSVRKPVEGGFRVQRTRAGPGVAAGILQGRNAGIQCEDFESAGRSGVLQQRDSRVRRTDQKQHRRQMGPGSGNRLHCCTILFRVIDL